ncbi:hypothetical protein ACMU9U_000748 [Yersinia enterocolitica]|uniref:hypothetical protein n=3 Tax=Yersinia enterocolitica TaxID=630 RepID=UPI001C60EDBF|nr:hypothetical protein [Yersinia enterocolitica]EKN3739927.1 hypothetical protein [Yersinia enterocolitica]EKN5985937.1 hypothetical protein [Yersinia enterocolitica]EKN5989321.1 hypothetical protein [Yersinia enterocolitica]ELX2243766.1 hypothetical protein [Yersinia enterocolitica]MBW5838649.1 hypothetical protein [Yersinia enterocolitica]
MVNDNAFSSLVLLLSGSEISDSNGYLVAKLDNNIYHDDDHIKNLLIGCEYTNSANCLAKEENNKVLYISRNTDCWVNGESPLYTTHTNFWKQIHTSDSLPSIFFIQEDKSSSCDLSSSNIISTYKSFFAWKKLLSTIADHSENSKAIIFITNDKGVKKLEIPLSIECNQLNSITNAELCFQEIKNLQDILDIPDPHKKNRLSVMCSSLAEVINSLPSEDNILLELIKKSPTLAKKYDNLYDIYTRRFSVNKLLNELDEKSLEFTSKINEYISSSQNKALTIPGALIAVGALAKIGGILESLIIFGGLLMIKQVTTSANDIYRESFSSLEKRLDSAFKKYLKFDEGKEVKDSASDIEQELRIQLSNASKRLDNIDSWASYMVWGSLLYIIPTIIIHYYPDFFLLANEYIMSRLDQGLNIVTQYIKQINDPVL